MDEPRIGEPVPEWREGRCAYSLDEESITCMADPAWHGISDDYRGMLCCDQHKPLMAMLSHWVHAAEGACLVPEGMFLKHENRCHLPWDQERLSVREAAALQGAR